MESSSDGRRLLDKDLEEAAERGDVVFLEEAVKKENERGGDFEVFLGSNGFGQNILHRGLAVGHNRAGWVKAAVKLLPRHVIQELVCQVDNLGQTTLYYAAMERELETVKLLDEYVCEDQKVKLWSMQDMCGDTLLHLASNMYRWVDLLQYVVDKYPSVALNNFLCIVNALERGYDKKLMMLILSAIIIGDDDDDEDKKMKMLSIKDNSPPLLHLAAINGHFEAVQFVVVRYPLLALDVNDDQQTALHLAIINGQTEVVKCLLDTPFLQQHKDDLVSSAKHLGNTMLHLAAQHGHLEVARLLVSREPQLALARNNHQQTPLHLAIIYDKHVPIDEVKAMKAEDIPRMIKMLVEKENGVVRWRDADGLTPLHRAAYLCASYNVKVVTFIVQQCPESAEDRDGWGNTILHLLIDRITSYEEGIKLLQIPEIRALRNTKNKHRKTPLDLSWSFNIKMVRALLDSFSEEQNAETISTSSMIKQQLRFQMLEKQKLAMEECGVIEWIPIIRMKIQESGMNFLLSKDSQSNNILHKLMRISHSTTIISYEYSILIEEILVRNPRLIFEINMNGDTPVHILVKNPPSTQIQSSVNDDEPIILLGEITFLKCLLDLCERYCYIVRASAEGNQYAPPWLMQNVQGNTPLHEAIIINNEQTLQRKLFELDIKITAKLINKCRETPLHIVAGHSNKSYVGVEDIRALMEANKKAIEMEDQDGLTPGDRALNAGNLTVLKIMLQGYWSCILEGEPIFHISINHSPDVLELLLKKRDDFNWEIYRRNKDGKGILHLTVERKLDHHTTLILENVSQEIASLLIIKDKRGRTPFHSMIDNPNLDYHQLQLVDKYFHVAKRVKMVAELLKEQDIDEGKTPLHLAIQHQYFDLASKFLDIIFEEMEKCLTIKDNEGRTCLHLLLDVSTIDKKQNVHKLVEKYLRAAKAKNIAAELLKEQDSEYKTPLHLAIECRYFDLVCIFFDKYLGKKEMAECLKLPDKNGVTPSDLLGPIEIPQQLREIFKKEPTLVGIRSIWDVPTPQMQSYTNTMGVIAALLVTITFTAAFTVPGGLHSENTNPPNKVSNTGTPLLLQRAAFKVFMVFDILSMCLSTMVLFCLLWVVASTDQGKAMVLLDFSILLLLISFYTTLVTFMSGIFATVFPITSWLAILTLVLCSSLIAMMNKYLVMEHMVPFAKALLMKWTRFKERTKKIIVRCRCSWKSSSGTSTSTALSESPQNHEIQETASVSAPSPFKYFQLIIMKLCTKLKPSHDQQSSANPSTQPQV